MRAIAVALLLLVAACAPTVDGTEMGGVAQWYGVSPGPAIEAANKHCSKYGRIARPSQTDAYSGYLTFSCDRPERS